jgi:hypothetical protein
MGCAIQSEQTNTQKIDPFIVRRTKKAIKLDKKTHYVDEILERYGWSSGSPGLFQQNFSLSSAYSMAEFRIGHGCHQVGPGNFAEALRVVLDIRNKRREKETRVGVLPCRKTGAIAEKKNS